MAKIYFDTNFFIDLVEKRKNIDLEQFSNNKLYLSALSIHILVYVYKYKIPNKELAKIRKFFSIVAFDEMILSRSLLGPTKDLEDNIQLHSATKANCSHFLTRDKDLLKLGYFGSVSLVEHL